MLLIFDLDQQFQQLKKKDDGVSMSFFSHDVYCGQQDLIFLLNFLKAIRKLSIERINIE
jgi:hypothetical protein